MEDVRFLSIEQVLKIHERVIELHGGSTELHDRGLLESAIAMPQSMFGGQYLHADLAAMAGAYWFHINKNHAFVDGNKRVALTAAETFLAMNGRIVEATNEEVVEVTLQIADGRLNKHDLSEWLRGRLCSRA